MNLQTENHPGGRRTPVKGLSVIAALFTTCVVLASSANMVWAQKKQRNSSGTAATEARAAAIPLETMVTIVSAEDTRNWADNLPTLIFDKDPGVRRRVALAAGRIGDERAVPSLIVQLQTDRDASVRMMAAFALGEMESASGADALIFALKRTNESSEFRARVLEAMGKIAAALPKTDEAHMTALGETVLNALNVEAARGAQADKGLVLAGLTAALRAHPANTATVVAKFLSHKDE
ncbi:MAG TPA: HEAT repeat domain-containing protein, partial [Pyrinomonadaceae bacterium]